MHRFRRFLVAVSNQAADHELVRYAAAAANLGEPREIHLVHVLPDTGRPNDHDRAAEQLEKLAADCAPAIPLRRVVLKGALEDRLLSHALEQEADVLFLGHRPARSGRKSLARRLAMKSPCSIWVVPQGSAPVFQRVLVPVDFSSPSADALQIGRTLAQRAGAGPDTPVRALHVFANDAFAPFNEGPSIARGREQETLRSFLADIPESPTPVRGIFEEGANVSQVIVRKSEEHDCDILVMSTRGRSPSTSVLLGSVTEDVIVNTRKPLLVVKHYGAKLSLLQALLHIVQQRGSQLHYN